VILSVAIVYHGLVVSDFNFRFFLVLVCSIPCCLPNFYFRCPSEEDDLVPPWPWPVKYFSTFLLWRCGLTDPPVDFCFPCWSFPLLSELRSMGRPTAACSSCYHLPAGAFNKLSERDLTTVPYLLSIEGDGFSHIPPGSDIALICAEGTLIVEAVFYLCLFVVASSGFSSLRAIRAPPISLIMLGRVIFWPICSLRTISLVLPRWQQNKPVFASDSSPCLHILPLRFRFRKSLYPVPSRLMVHFFSSLRFTFMFFQIWSPFHTVPIECISPLTCFLDVIHHECGLLDAGLIPCHHFAIFQVFFINAIRGPPCRMLMQSDAFVAFTPRWLSYLIFTPFSFFFLFIWKKMVVGFRSSWIRSREASIES